MSNHDELSLRERLYSWMFWEAILLIILVGCIGGIMYIVHYFKGVG